MVAEAKPAKLTGREAVSRRARERAAGERAPSEAFRDEVLAALVEELRNQDRKTRELVAAIGSLERAVVELTSAMRAQLP